MVHAIPPDFHPRRRVVITGIGMVTPFGVGTERTWQKLINGEKAIIALKDSKYSELPCRVAGIVPRGKDPGFFDETSMSHAPSSRNAPFVQFALAAADEAVIDAGFDLQKNRISSAIDPYRVSVCIGSGMGSIDDIITSGKLVDDNQHRKVSAYFVPKVLLNMAGAQVVILRLLVISLESHTFYFQIGDRLRSATD
jgi:3-oxoacyl-[acyl-carrier-protein] synthase II